MFGLDKFYCNWEKKYCYVIIICEESIFIDFCRYINNFFIELPQKNTLIFTNITTMKHTSFPGKSQKIEIH